MEIARFVPEGGRVADIGSDHALLPVYLVQQGRAVRAVAGEIREGPLKVAQRQVQKSGLAHCIAVRLGDGLEVIAPGEVDTVVIAGMGGAAIAGILERGRDRLAGVSRLVLQPNIGSDTVRRWLFEQDWLLEAETIVRDDGFFYEILLARRAVTEGDRAANTALYAPYAVCPGLELERDMLFVLGPHLVREGGEAFAAKWEEELARRDKILQRMTRAETREGLARRRELQQETDKIREVLRCLQTDKR